MLSRKAKYGIKALSALARAPFGTPVQISTLAADEHIPHKFLEAILFAARREKAGATNCSSPQTRSPMGRSFASLMALSPPYPVPV